MDSTVMLLRSFNLSTMAGHYEEVMIRAEKEAWSAGETLRHLCESEAAKRDLRLDAELKKLDRFDVLILDDIGYVQQSREEMEVLFTLLAERYERRSLLISSNLVFSQWDQIFQDPMTTMAAIDRLVHHSIILEFDTWSSTARASG
jgi:DNA replication protein DnaC